MSDYSAEGTIEMSVSKEERRALYKILFDASRLRVSVRTTANGLSGMWWWLVSRLERIRRPSNRNGHTCKSFACKRDPIGKCRCSCRVCRVKVRT